MECYVIFLSFVNFILSLFIILYTGGVYLYFSSESYVLMFLLTVFSYESKNVSHPDISFFNQNYN